MDLFIHFSATPNRESRFQILDVQVDGVGELHILNLLEAGNPINKEASEWYPEDWKRTIETGKLEFHRKRVGSENGLLKIPELNYRPILVHTDVQVRQHDFLICYREHDLTGLKFKEIWADE